VADLATTRCRLEELAATPVADVVAPGAPVALAAAPQEGQAALAQPGATW
jgi:hypothetical protein